MMERGIRRLEIFQDEFDYQVFLEILKKESEQKKCNIHAYCLMTNHFHLLAESQNVEIGKFMKSLAGKYAMYYNHRHSYKGHVFEDRYKSCLVETDEYFLQTSRYIHLNPVKAKMTEHPEDYKWSSYRNGLDICYPSEHEKLKECIENKGLVISEYPPGIRPTKYTFPKRNRLISAWSDELIVVAAGKKSGALITADYSKKYGRKIIYCE